MKLYRIKTISEADFGCEGTPENRNTQVAVLLEGSLGSEKWIHQDDAYLYEKEINESDIVSISEEGLLEKRFGLRGVTDEDAEAVIEIEQICFPPHEACTPKSMKERVENAPECFQVLVDVKEKRVVGFINGVATDEEKFQDKFFTDISEHNPEGKYVMICGVDVLPEYEGRGLAGLMMNGYKESMKRLGKQKLILTNLQRLTHFYEKMGFVDLGIADSSWGGEEWHEMEYEIK